MPRLCSICKKGPMFGQNVSRANNKTKKVSKPNLQSVMVATAHGRKRALVCTRCLRSNAIAKG